MLLNNISQTEAITKCNEMYNGHKSGIKSKLVNGYAWDTALKFINAVEGKNVDTDSSAWGNYNSSLANTGAISNAVACNIYDMAGNLYEWTTEKYNSPIDINYPFTVIIGGNYNGDGVGGPAGYRNYRNPTSTSNYIGFRSLLFK